MARLSLGVSGGEERRTRRTPGLFISVTADHFASEGSTLYLVDGGVKGPPSTNHHASSYLSLHTVSLSNVRLGTSLPFLFRSVDNLSFSRGSYRTNSHKQLCSCLHCLSFSGSSSLIVVVVVNGPCELCPPTKAKSSTSSSRRRRRSQRCPPLLPTANSTSPPLFTFTPSMTPSSLNTSPSFRNNA